MGRKASDFVVAPRSDEDLQRIYKRVRAPAPPPQKVPLVAVALVAAALFVLYVAWPADHQAPRIEAEAPIETADDSPSLDTQQEDVATVGDADGEVDVPTPTTSPSKAPVAATAKQLWSQAVAARLAGNVKLAEQLYLKLVKNHPNDARAGLAAMELARIRLDSLDDAQGAVDAYNFALKHGAGAVVDEDAQAGRIDALHRAGQLDACREARRMFLAEHPNSAHAERLNDLCEP